MNTNQSSNDVARPAHPYCLPEWSIWSECRRYVLAATLVLLVFVTLSAATRLQRAPEDAPETDNAVMVDLPAASPSPQPKSEADDGPEQAASNASSAVNPPKPIDPPGNPVDETKPADTMTAPTQEPPPPILPHPMAIIEPGKQENSPLPPPMIAPSATAQDEKAPEGFEAPTTRERFDDVEGLLHASPLAITLWQKAMMGRLEAAKRSEYRRIGVEGTVKIAFAIDSKGDLVSEVIAQSSGVDTIDKAALALIKKAAPYPVPPAGVASKDLVFTVPVRYKHRQP